MMFMEYFQKNPPLYNQNAISYSYMNYYSAIAPYNNRTVTWTWRWWYAAQSGSQYAADGTSFRKEYDPISAFYQKRLAPFHRVQYHQLYLSIYETANCPWIVPGTWNRHQCVFWFPIIWWSKSWTITLYVKDTTSMGRYPFLLDRNTISAIRKPCSRQLSAHSGIIEKYAPGMNAQSVNFRTYPDWKADGVGLCGHRQHQ